MNLEQSKVQQLAKVLRILVIVAFVCNIVALFLVPGLAMWKGDMDLRLLTPYENELSVALRKALTFVLSWKWIWQYGQYQAVLTLFLWTCGICTAVTLWQARKVLGTIVDGCPFDPANSKCMMRAAVCCAIIAAAALIRLIWGFCTYKSIGPLLTYNALFVPVFIMGFLLCMVMSALFRRANELKEENDLTI